MDHVRLITDYSDKSFAVVVDNGSYLIDDFRDMGGRFNAGLVCGPGWIFSTAKHLDAITNLFLADGVNFVPSVLTDEERAEKERRQKEKGNKNATGKGKATSTPDYILNDEERKEWARNMGDEKTYCKYYPVICRLEGGELVAIETSDLKTEFWHHDEGPGFDEHNRVTATSDSKRDYFISENTSKLTEVLDALRGKSRDYTGYNHLWLANWSRGEQNEWRLHWSNVHPDSTNCRDAIGWHDSRLPEMYDKGFYRKLSDSDKQRLITAYTLAADKQRKRCETWLKRYGVDKLSFRTYWADR